MGTLGIYPVEKGFLGTIATQIKTSLLLCVKRHLISHVAKQYKRDFGGSLLHNQMAPFLKVDIFTTELGHDVCKGRTYYY